jgi:hypothetical protein
MLSLSLSKDLTAVDAENAEEEGEEKEKRGFSTL